ncbi:MAG TPA: hypothetical protein VNW99_00065 [Cytophagaceae bacterium]|jgi:hypothetical protein|nr:hypothetical protein [Cytophagaceae bacterium]
MKFQSKINYLCLVPKIFFIVFLILLNLFFYGVFIYEMIVKDGSISIKACAIVLSLWLILNWVTFYMIRSLFIGTLKIIINDTGLEIRQPLMGARNICRWNQIKEFYTSYEYNKQRSFAQIIIYFKTRKKLKISEESLINYNEMVNVLKASPVKYAGFKEQSLIDFE